ncbi:MAG: L-threonylcarbamoyladenylate synthase [Lentimicrobiaceae bacterium]|jgi:L-threonylcarbamoyladenylate synthase
MDFENDIEKSLQVLEKGGTLLYPTDTIWGIGCDATNTKAVEKIYRIKSRSEAKSLIVLIDHIDKLSTYIEKVPDITGDLLASITNPVTIIYSNARKLAPNVIAPDGTIAIRIVKDDFCTELIRRFGKPIVSTSANISGFEFPVVFSQIDEEIKKSVDYIVSYKQDYYTRTKPSTIIRLRDDGIYSIIRG